MEKLSDHICCHCCGQMKYYDSVKRISVGKYGRKKHVIVPRFRCVVCGHIERSLPIDIFPFKHYEKEIIIGVVEGLITCETFGFEDYPSELTMLRWIKNPPTLILQTANSNLE